MAEKEKTPDVWYIQNLTWLQAKEILPGAAAILPVGAIEAHGPHLPIGTDILISRAVAARSAELLREHGVSSVVLPSLTYTAALSAREFPGTITIPAEALMPLLVGIAESLAAAKTRVLAIVNSHFEPAHRAILRDAVAKIGSILPVAYPDYARKVHAVKLTDEFRSGACHAGQFETSLMLAIRQDLVRWDVAKTLADNPQSLTAALKEGKDTFEKAGGREAYFGFPAKATAAEGAKSLETMAKILADAVEETA